MLELQPSVWTNVQDNVPALIVGAGPAGLTAAHELLERGQNVLPIVFERSSFLGGISSTHNYKGNRIDLGGHRFFSKSDRVMEWWLRFLPLQGGIPPEVAISYQQHTRQVSGTQAARQCNPDQCDLVMLVRKRLSRIFYLRKLFDYPLGLNGNTLANLGPLRLARIAGSYAWACLFPIRPEDNLEQFFINRFGRELYRTFFESYTEKVWGVPCSEDPRGVGSPAHQGSLGCEGPPTCGHQALQPGCGGYPAKADRDFPDRAIPLPEVRPGANVGGGRPAGCRKGRKNPAQPGGGRGADGGQPDYGSQGQGQSHRSNDDVSR